MGFDSSRPCNDHGIGPDNLWIDLRNKKMIAFELKTEKSSTSVLSKDDIGQGLNHHEWLKKQYPEIKLIGLIFLTDTRLVSDKATPSKMMYFGSQQTLRKVWDEFLATVERIRPKTQMERFIEAGKIGELSEWSTEGIFKRLIDGKMT
jgi:hypothetical protein